MARHPLTGKKHRIDIADLRAVATADRGETIQLRSPGMEKFSVTVTLRLKRRAKLALTLRGLGKD